MYNNVIVLIKTCIYDEVRSLYNDKRVRGDIRILCKIFFIDFSLNVSYYSGGCIDKTCLGCTPFLQNKSPNIYYSNSAQKSILLY